MMIHKRTFLLLCILLLFLVGCVSTSTQDNDTFLEEFFTEDFRVQVLYEHTLMMIEFNISVDALDVSVFENVSPVVSIDDKLLLLQQSYGVNLSTYSKTEQITILEDMMYDMMHE